MNLRRLAPLVLCTALLASPKISAEQPLDISLFPEIPFQRSVMVDSDIPKTGINAPLDLNGRILDESFSSILPYASLSKELPILSVDINAKPDGFIPNEIIFNAEAKASIERKKLSETALSALIIAGGSLNFPKDENPRYDSRLELFLNSPMIDDYLSDGNKLFLVAGLNGKGSLKLENIASRNISSFLEMISPDSYSFFGDIYIVAKSPYSDQFFILRGGINLPGDAKEKSNAYISTTWEFPSLTFWMNSFSNLKMLPYASLGAKLSIDGLDSSASAQLGMKLTGDSKKSIIAYVQADYITNKEMSYSSGLKLDF